MAKAQTNLGEPDQIVDIEVTNALGNLSIAMIGLWIIGIVFFLVAATRLPTVL